MMKSNSIEHSICEHHSDQKCMLTIEELIIDFQVIENSILSIIKQVKLKFSY